MYKSLYRKWRPKIFDDVIGQENITNILKNEIISNKISHAYLFTGSRGTGKTSCAKILAKAVNCKNPKDGNPCGECETCKNIESGNCLDIVEIDAASNNGVENIREMRDEIVFTPGECKYRVYIVDEVHMLSLGAFNAFLKTLEEPPSHVIFILATTEIHKLPLTITSRCQKFKFKGISENNIVKRLKYICSQEKIDIEDSGANLIAKHAGGAMRDALSILDQCQNICKCKIDESAIKNMLGISDEEEVESIVKMIISSNFSETLKKIDEIHLNSGNISGLLKQLTEYFRNLMIIKSTGNVDGKDIPDNVSLEDILYCIDKLQESGKNMNLYDNKKLEMETVAVKLCLRFSPKENSSINNSNINSEKNYWEEVIEEMKKNNNLKSLYISLKNSKAHKDGSRILIECENKMAFEFLKKPEFRFELKNIISKVTGKNYSIGPYIQENEKIEKAVDEETEKNPLDDLIKNAKESNIDIVID